MEHAKITIIVDNVALPPLVGEHGLSLLIEFRNETVLFDTGAGNALPVNRQALGIATDRIRKGVLSHSHYDHTGGLAELLPRIPESEWFHGPGILRESYSLHPGNPPKPLKMPDDSRRAFAAHSFKREIREFTRIGDGLFLTGPIPRFSGEDCGGPFFQDAKGEKPDWISEEQALLLENGVLIQGCCHAGIINTVEYCRKHHPEIRIHTILGGLHLLHASEDRLKRTADYLKKLSLKRLILLHCTGEAAGKYLLEQEICETVVGKAGETYDG